jgi:DNA-dependent metalloprotease WSS1
LDDLSYLFKSAKAALTGSIPPPNPYEQYQSAHQPPPPPPKMSRSVGGNGGSGRREERFFGEYTHLANLPQADYALHTLRKLASAVMPIMRKRGWRVGTLSEFYPDQANLLGLNVNAGQQIMVRLRSPYNVSSFMLFEQCLDTLLHEYVLSSVCICCTDPDRLCHIVRGPHDDVFHRHWNELRSEWETLVASGYTGEGFLGKGQQVGGNYMPAEEVRRKARAAAAEREKDRVKRGRRIGQTIGGRPGDLPIRDAVAIATISRIGDNSSKGKGRDSIGGSTEEITAGCGQGSKRAEQEGKDAMVNGFKTKEDMDEANWMAIQAAQFELEEAEEQKRLQMGLQPTEPNAGPSQLIPASDGEGMYTWDPEYGLRPAKSVWKKPEEPRTTQSAPPQERRPPPRPERNSQGKPVSRIVKEAEDSKRKKAAGTGSSKRSSSSSAQPGSSGSWPCTACTFVNMKNKSKCEVCESDRPDAPKRSVSRKRSTSFSQSLGWNCPRCTTFMGHEWWVCSSCGTMKQSS